MKFTPRDLITVGIFTALMVVNLFGVGMLGAVAPMAMLFSLPLMMFIAGTLFAIFVSRISGPGPTLLMTGLLGLLMTASGHALPTLATTVIAAICCELILATGRYRSAGHVIAAAAVFSQFNDGALLPLLWNADAYLNNVAGQMGPAYAEGMRTLLSPPVLLALMLGMAVTAALGGLLGVRLNARHFRRIDTATTA